MNHSIILGDSIEQLKLLRSESVDSLVTDPPAGISIYNQKWDGDRGGRDEWINWLSSIAAEAHRVLKPGSFGFVWALPRTSHWTATAFENAGFQIKDIVTHLFGSGFPKNLDVAKAFENTRNANVDKIFEVTKWIRDRRDELGLKNSDLDRIAGIRGGASHWTARPPSGQPELPTADRWIRLQAVLGEPPNWISKIILKSDEEINAEAQANAQKWNGWGTALKPANENWILIQKPIAAPNVAANVAKYGVGVMKINYGRIPTLKKIPDAVNLTFHHGDLLWDPKKRNRTSVYQAHELGRFPSNVVLSVGGEDCPKKAIDEQAGKNASEYFKNLLPERPYFYCKKPSTKERGVGNKHPTVKPIRLMKYLCNLITPPGGTVLDPFMGSGTTGVAAISDGFKFIGIEQHHEYFECAKQRCLEAEVGS